MLKLTTIAVVALACLWVLLIASSADATTRIELKRATPKLEVLGAKVIQTKDRVLPSLVLSLGVNDDKYCNRPDGCQLWCGSSCMSVSCNGDTLYRGDGCYCMAVNATTPDDLCTTLSLSSAPYCCQ